MLFVVSIAFVTSFLFSLSDNFGDTVVIPVFLTKVNILLADCSKIQFSDSLQLDLYKRHVLSPLSNSAIVQPSGK